MRAIVRARAKMCVSPWDERVSPWDERMSPIRAALREASCNRVQLRLAEGLHCPRLDEHSSISSWHHYRHHARFRMLRVFSGGSDVCGIGRQLTDKRRLSVHNGRIAGGYRRPTRRYLEPVVDSA